MPTSDRMVNARRACLLLVPVTEPDTAAIVLTRNEHGELIADLINEFLRLDKAEKRRAKQNKLNARNAGRPKVPDEKASPRTLARRKAAQRGES